MAGRALTLRTRKKTQEKFLLTLAETGQVTRAAKAARVARETLYQWRAADDEFAKAWEQALEKAYDVLESEAIRRATEGVLRPVYQGGVKVGTVREYSDTLLIFTLKGGKPEKYRERTEAKVVASLEISERLQRARERVSKEKA